MSKKKPGDGEKRFLVTGKGRNTTRREMTEPDRVRRMAAMIKSERLMELLKSDPEPEDTGHTPCDKTKKAREKRKAK